MVAQMVQSHARDCTRLVSCSVFAWYGTAAQRIAQQCKVAQPQRVEMDGCRGKSEIPPP